MHTVIDANRPSEFKTLDGKTVHPRNGSNQKLPPLRPFWGLMPCRRGYDIRPVRTQDQRGVANTLVRRMYAWRGYNTESIGHRPDDPNWVTLAAWQFDEIVATITLGVDSSAGLLADALYGKELAALRRPNRLICEVSRLAVDPDFSSRELLASLFQAALQYAKEIFSASDAVIEINPRHACYYERRLGFRQIGSLRTCQRVAAPAVLLHQELSEMAIPDAL